MPIERLIDELIDAGWTVIETDFDEKAFARWRQSAYDCVAALLAPDHPCLRFFRDHVKEADAIVFSQEGAFYTLCPNRGTKKMKNLVDPEVSGG